MSPGKSENPDGRQPLWAGCGARHGDHQDGGGRGLVDEQHAVSEESTSHSQRCEERDRRGDSDGDRAETARDGTGHCLDGGADANPEHHSGDQLQGALAAEHPVLGQRHGRRGRGEERLVMPEQGMGDIPGQPGGDRGLHDAPPGVGHPPPGAADG
jgi:hypothetical protein